MTTRIHPAPPVAAASGAAPKEASRKDWFLLLALVVCGGSSFSGIRIAVETASPAIVAAGRLWIGALILYIYMRGTGRRMLPFKANASGIDRAWIFAVAIGLTGYAAPLALFPFAQQTVSSMLAGIYMAFMPIATVFLAAIFAGEPLTVRKLIGFAAGTLGVIVLIGPSALQGLANADVVAQLALIAATTGYAISSVLTRRAPDAPARSFAVAFVLTGALLATPLALLHPEDLAAVSFRSWLAIIYLGVVPTGMNAIIIITIIRSAGAGFMAMGNYLTPGIAIGFGILLFGERLEPRYALGLLVILAGLAIAQPGPARAFLSRLSRKG